MPRRCSKCFLRVFTYDFKQAKDIQQFNFYFVAHCFMFFLLKFSPQAKTFAA